MPLPTLVLRAPSHAQLSLTPLRRATIVQPWIKIAPDLSTACRSRWTSWVLPEPTTARLWPRLDTTNSSPDVEVGTRVLQLLLVSSWLLFRFLRQRLAELPGTDLAIFVQIRFLKLLVLHLLLLLVALDLNFFVLPSFGLCFCLLSLPPISFSFAALVITFCPAATFCRAAWRWPGGRSRAGAAAGARPASSLAISSSRLRS